MDDIEDWLFDDDWDWGEDEEDKKERLYDLCQDLAELFFVSDNDFYPDAYDDYCLGHLDPKDWWPLVNELDRVIDLASIVEQAVELEALLALPGLPTELLEDPYTFLESVLQGHLPSQRPGRKVDSRRLVKIALLVVEILKTLPGAARVAVRTWTAVHRQILAPAEFGYEEDLADSLIDPNLPPAMTGFSMMIALTLMRWPKRAEGLPLPSEFDDPDLYDEVLVQWEALPLSPSSTGDDNSPAEALFAQGQLAHMLAQMGTVELLHDDVEEQDAALAYSRLSRAILWVHDECRLCPKREGVACLAATGWPDRPVPLIDVASEVANTAHIEGCVRI